ncbi:MAG: DUF6263 family protein [Ginsengibacter sp.]
MKKIFLIFTGAFCFSLATFAQSNQTLTLIKGDKYQVENKLETTNSTNVQGQDMESKMNVYSTYHISVKDKANNNYKLTNTITHMVMAMSMMGNDINFDSDKKEDLDGQMGTALKGYINQPKEVVIDNSGKIISKDETDTSAIAKQLNIAATGYGTQMAFQSLPKNSKVGSTWTENNDDNGIKRNTNYTIKSIDGSVATIGFDGTVTTEATMEQQGMEVSTKTTGKFSGEEKVDMKTGVVQLNTTTGEASGTFTAMGQDFPTSSKIISTTTVKAL